MVNAETDSGPHQTSRDTNLVTKIFNGINPVNTLAKFSASGVWQSPEVLK